MHEFGSGLHHVNRSQIYMYCEAMADAASRERLNITGESPRNACECTPHTHHEGNFVFDRLRVYHPGPSRCYTFKRCSCRKSILYHDLSGYRDFHLGRTDSRALPACQMDQYAPDTDHPNYDGDKNASRNHSVHYKRDHKNHPGVYDNHRN